MPASFHDDRRQRRKETGDSAQPSSSRLQRLLETMKESSAVLPSVQAKLAVTGDDGMRRRNLPARVRVFAGNLTERRRERMRG